MTAAEIDVACVETDRTWACAVRVRDRGGATEHEVSVDEIDLPAALDGAETPDVERLVQRTFEFLLERESKDQILRRFELPVVARFFPDYPREIERRLSAGE